MACTTIIVGKKLTKDGSIIHAHLEDMGVNAVGKLWRVESCTHKETLALSIPYVEIPQIDKTHAYWASGNADIVAGLGVKHINMPYDNVLVGYNERGVVMSCNWCYSKEKNFLEHGIRRYAMRQLLLERANTAVHGVELIGGWIDKYGQADWGGLQYQISDPMEAWIVETTSSQWIARKIRDEEIFVAANRFTIGTQFDSASAGLVPFALEKGWFDGKEPLHFADTYTLLQRRNSPYDTDRESRVLFLLEPQKGIITPVNVLRVLQDRYDGTNLFHIPDDEVEIWEGEAEKTGCPRPICTNLAQSFFVTKHTFENQKDETVMFFGLGTPGYSGIIPLYKECGEVPPPYSREADVDMQAWRLFRKMQKLTDKYFSTFSAEVQSFWEERNASTILRVEKSNICDSRKRALDTFKTSYDNLNLARKFLKKLVAHDERCGKRDKQGQKGLSFGEET
ncbi:MAG: C69 family dipeptidase [Synergistaceae bacterium]|nr:C69 family dipeptidase [Synergistaceae bacterium]